jgi:hypothetical protein
MVSAGHARQWQLAIGLQSVESFHSRAFQRTNASVQSAMVISQSESLAKLLVLLWLLRGTRPGAPLVPVPDSFANFPSGRRRRHTPLVSSLKTG